MPINLSKGQKVDLTKGNPGLKNIMVGLGWDVNAYDSGADFDPNQTDVILSSKNGSIKLIDKGVLPVFSEEEALSVLQPDEITAECILHEGNGEATAWGCDLTYDYVKINADYRS